MRSRIKYLVHEYISILYDARNYTISATWASTHRQNASKCKMVKPLYLNMSY